MNPRDEWKRAYEASRLRDATFTTMSGVPLEPVYGPDDGEFPGVYPYTRGPYASMYRSKLWTMRMFAGFGTADDTNWRFKEIIRAGGDGLSTAFDMPTLLGIDSDDAMALGEVGRCGVAIDTLADMEDLYAGIDLGDDHDVDDDQLAGGGDLRHVRRPGREGGDRPRAARRHAAERHLEGVPGAEGVRVPAAAVDAAGARHDHVHRGGDAALALDLDLRLPHPRGRVDGGGGAGVHVGERVRVRRAGAGRPGLPVDAFAPRLSFFFNAHIDFFEEIAKYRAARRIWARWMRERYGATAERSLQLRFHTQTAGVSLTAQQPEVNIVRTAIEALAGVLGGTQSLHTNSMDEALALPTEKAARIALRTQQVIANETNVANVADPLGGSWFVEALTDEMERQAEELFAHLDELGDGSMLEGCIQGIEDNWFQGQIADSAYELERKFNEGRRTIVGVNRFTEGNDDSALEILQITNEDEARQLKRLEQVRHDRDQAAVDAALARLRTEAADPEVNLMPALIDAVERVRHPRRDDERPRRRLRPPHRGPHDLTALPSECLRPSEC